MSNEIPRAAPYVAGIEELPRPGAFAALTLAEALGVLHPEWPMPAIRELFARGLVVGTLQSDRGQDERPLSPRERVSAVSRWRLRARLAGDAEIYRGGEERGDDPSERLEPRILVETDEILAIDKPAGLPVVPDRAAERESCLGWLIERELAGRRAGRPLEEAMRPRIVHRIDRFTSGLVLVARTPDAERRLAADFESRRVRKEYGALVCGVLEAAVVEVGVPIASGRKGRMRSSPTGREARTRFEVRERFDDFTWVAAFPRTGRTHQIRLHALAMGHPLAVDPLYRTSAYREHPVPPGIERLSLHAGAVELDAHWPEPRRFEAPLAEDLAGCLAQLRSSAARSGS